MAERRSNQHYFFPGARLVLHPKTQCCIYCKKPQLQFTFLLCIQSSSIIFLASDSPPICRFHDRPPFPTFPLTFPSFFSPLSPGWIGLISNMQYQYMRLLMLCKFYIFHYCIINMVLSVSYQILATLQYWILKKPSPLLWTKRVIYFLCTVCLEWLDSVQCVIYIYNIIYVVYKLFLYQITFYFFKYILCGS